MKQLLKRYETNTKEVVGQRREFYHFRVRFIPLLSSLHTSLVLALYLFSSCFIPLTHAAEDPKNKSALAILTTIQGTVEIQSGEAGGWKPAKKGAYLNQGDQVRTGASSKASIFYTEGSEIRIASNSVLALKGKQAQAGKGERNVTKLPQGKLWAKFLKQETSQWIETPSAVAAVKGTEFEITVVNNDRTDVLVMEGLLQLMNDQGMVLAGANTHTTISAGKPPTTPQPTDIAKREKWEELAGPTKKTLYLKMKTGDKEEEIKLRFKRK